MPVWITTFRAAGEVALGAQLKKQQIALGNTSAAVGTDANPREQVRIRVFASEDCHVEVGAAPDCTTDSMPMEAGQTEYFFGESGWVVEAITRS